MNVVDSKDANIELVCVWNYIEEKAEDQEVADYAKKKREQLDRLLQGKIESDKNKKDFDKQYAMLIDKEIRSELLESKKLSDKNKKDFDLQYAMLIEKELREVQKYDKMMRRKRKWRL